MKKSELIRKHYDALYDAMLERYNRVLQANGRTEYDIYIWSDGEIEGLCKTQGDNSWLVAGESEPCDLYYVTTVTTGPCFDIWDVADHSAPEDDAEREAEEEELREYLAENYREQARTELDDLIEELERDERYSD